MSDELMPQNEGPGLGEKAKETGKEAVRKGADKAKEKVKEKAKQKMKEVAKKKAKKKVAQKAVTQVASKAALAGPLGYVLMWAAIIILIIIVVIGIIMFLVTMPGMVMDKLKQLGRAIGNAIASFFGADETELMATEEKQYEILTYLEQMGYDLAGEGFLSTLYEKDDINKDNGYKVDESDSDHDRYAKKYKADNGVIKKKEDGSIDKADSFVIYNYLISDNYCYTVSNFNTTTTDKDGYDFFDWLESLVMNVAKGLTGGKAAELWGRGLIWIYHENGDYYGNGPFWWNDISVDAESKTLSIRRGWGNNKMVYSLDGWTGRYGMPLEFLLSVQLATKMPDLAYDMTKVYGAGQNEGSESEGTKVEILLHELNDAAAVSAYKADWGNDEYITFEKFDQIKSEGWFFTDGWTLSKEEAYKIIKLGINSPDNCTYLAPTFELLDATDNGEGWVWDEDQTKELELYGITDEDYEEVEADLAETVADTTDEEFSAKEAMLQVTDEEANGALESTAIQYGYDASKATEFVQNSTENGSGQLYDLNHEEGVGCTKGQSNVKDYSAEKYTKCEVHSPTFGAYTKSDSKKRRSYYIKKNPSYYKIEKSIITREWTAENHNDSSEDATYRWVSYVYKIYKYTDEERKKDKKYVTTYFFDYVMKDLTQQELIDAGVLNKDGTTKDEKRCSDAAKGGSTEVTKCCENCRKYVKRIIKLLKAGDDEDFDTYSPYISKVTGHWYRDVYFVSDGSEQFIQNDEEYEAIMGERWTLYETYEDSGLYKLYKLNSDGSIGELYNGTQQEADDNGIRVVKKAITFSLNDDSSKIGWSKGAFGTWSAYDTIDKKTTNWENLYPEDEWEEEPIKEKMFVKITSQNDIVQVEEGQRTETNPEIRDLFLNNTYFRYDGSYETAKVIEKLREKVFGSSEDNIVYGKLSESDLKKSVTVDGKTYTVKDVSGKVELNKDSLNAFSMLENTHTLDADFIYKDFKELVVELGFFTKEQLTDETPRIFAFPVPQIGSYGFPIAALDKKENEFGTQLHSMEDYQANVKNTFAALIASTSELPEDPEGAGPEQTTGEPQALVIKKPYGAELIAQVADLDATPMTRLTNIGKITDVPASTYTFNPTGDSEQGKKTGDLQIDGITYELYWQTKSTCTLYAYAFMASAYGGEPFETYIKTSSGSLVNATGTGQGGNNWWVQGAGANWGTMFGDSGIKAKEYLPSSPNVGEDVSEALALGKPVYFYGNLGASTYYHAIVLLGADSDGTVLYYDPFPGVVKNYGSSSSFAANLQSLLSNHFKHRIYIPDGIPTGVSKTSSGGSYMGFEGGEAVVSPVTGILLEYGTYDETIDPLTGEESRVNVDIKYGLNKVKDLNAEKEGSAETSTVEGEKNEEEATEKVVDKVGYAKIMILDDETYLALENKMKSSASKALSGLKNPKGQTVNSLVDENGNYYENKEVSKSGILEEGSAEKWSEDDITLYAYKEFAELYSDFEVSGNIIYIDGFVCEGSASAAKKDEEETPEEDEAEESEALGTGALTKSSFTTEYEENLYEKEERYNLSSQKASNKLNNENEMKDLAPAVVKVTVDGEERIIIKEGTVIGRTMTNAELAAKRGEAYTAPQAAEGAENALKANGAEVLGNYLRIIMRDSEDNVVENVEEYMKLDQEGAGVNSVSQEYQQQEGDLQLLANVLHLEGCQNFFTAILGDEAIGTSASRVTGYVLINRALTDYSGYGTTIKEQLIAPSQYECKQKALNGEDTTCEQCLANAEWCLTYDCSSVKNPDGEGMSREITGQSGWCQCPEGQKFNCWWWIDTTKDGSPTEYVNSSTSYDTFYCK